MTANQTGQKIGGLIFLIAFSLLAGHEMDAIARHEWRLLPGLSLLDDDPARDLFTLLHIPVYIGILWGAFFASDRARQLTRLVFCIAMMAHGAAHFILSDHVLYEFVPPVETITVYGAALAGLTYIIWIKWGNR